MRAKNPIKIMVACFAVCIVSVPDSLLTTSSVQAANISDYEIIEVRIIEYDDIITFPEDLGQEHYKFKNVMKCNT